MTELIAKNREKIAEKAKALRRQGILPAILCRKGKESVSLSIDFNSFAKVYKEAGETGVIQLIIQNNGTDSKTKNVLINEVARDPLSNEIIHADFQEIRMDEKLTASVPLVFIGESAVIKNEGGTLVRNMNEVEVKAFPNDLPRQIEVDISRIKTFDDRIVVKDLPVAEAVQILADLEEVVALAAPPRKEEEIITEAPIAEAETGEKAEDQAEEEPQEKAEK